MKRVYYIVSGHSVINNRGTGAMGYIDEAVEAKSLANDVVDLLVSNGFEAYTDPPAWSLTRVWNWLRKWIKPTDVMVDIHFNAGPPAANGIEVFIPNNWTGDELSLATSIAKGLHKATGIRLRVGSLGVGGVKLESSSQYNTLKLLGGLGVGIKVLVEVCFTTNKGDVASYHENRDRVVKALYDSIIENS